MNEYHLGVDDGDCVDDRFDASASAWGVLGQGGFLEFRHQAWNLAGRREWKVVFDEIDLPVFPSPRINRAKPNSMNLADIICRKPTIQVIAIDQLRHCAELFHKLGSVHLALAGDAEEVPKNPAV
jgi:hypothetical protein